MRIGKLMVVSAAAVGLGIFLGSVPLMGGQTAAELMADWLDRSGRKGVQQSKRIALKQSAAVAPLSGADRGSSTQTPRASASVPSSAAAVPENRAPSASEAAPITAGAANSPEQTSASDKAALDQLISKKTK